MHRSPPQHSRFVAIPVLLALLLVLLTGCVARRGSAVAGATSSSAARLRSPGSLLDPTPAYRAAGLIAHPEPLPFVGAIQFLATHTPDSTLVLLALSFANRALTFAEDATAGQQAAYSVTVDVQQGPASVHRFDARQTVRVSSFRETLRTDESIVFQRYFALVPGSYGLVVALRDEVGARTATVQSAVVVPRFGPRRLSSLVPVYRASLRETADSVPELIANPRSTVLVGRDSVVRVYLEGYALGADQRVVVVLLGDDRAPLWRDTVVLADQGELGAGLLSLPVARIGIGRTVLVARPVGTVDSVWTPLFVSFGDEWAAASLEEILSYLRYFTSPDRLRVLRDTLPEDRPATWLTFLRLTDPVPATPEHEGLRNYFARLHQANERFRGEGGPGWLTDRGKVLIMLGEPDQVLEQPPAMLQGRGRQQAWVYRRLQVRLLFIDPTGFGQWRLTPTSETELELLLRQERRQ